MHAKACLGGGMAMLAVVAVGAVEFPLTLKTVHADRAWTLPGGSGGHAQLQARKPSQIKSEPKAVSRHPLYGTFSRGEKNQPIAFRLDESKGNGKGYDTLIVDLNANNDLTDDAPIAATAKGATPERSVPQERNFGPIPAPEALCAGPWRPVDFAQLLLYNPGSVEQADSGAFLGYLRIRSGCYLETTVTLDGHTEKLAFFDANGNMRLGDGARSMNARGSGEEYVYFTDGDAVLRDRNGSGSYESDQFDTESEPFSDLLYVGAQPCRMSFAKDYTTLRLEPCAEKLGELSLQPKGDQVASATLARETKPKQWDLVAPAFVNGKARIPEGKYRLYQTVLSAKNSKGESVMTAAYNRTSKGTVTVTPDQTVALPCGAPLALKVTAQKQPASGAPSGAMGAALSLFGGNAGKNSGTDLAINLTVNGAGGEVYSGYVKGKNLQGRPPQPTFKVLTAEGKQVASGNLEYG